jgi:hypothetical protein
MADIVVSTDPKKAAFILDFRDSKVISKKAELKPAKGVKAGCKPRVKRIKNFGVASCKQKKACGSNDESVKSGNSVESGLGKRDSFCSVSTAASPKKKVKC